MADPIDTVRPALADPAAQLEALIHALERIATAAEAINEGVELIGDALIHELSDLSMVVVKAESPGLIITPRKAIDERDDAV